MRSPGSTITPPSRMPNRTRCTASSCPRSGSFEDFFPNSASSSTFSQVCRDELMTLSYRPHGAWQTRFSDPKGVDVEIEDYGEVASAPFYRPMFDALQAAGYTLDQNV